MLRAKIILKSIPSALELQEKQNMFVAFLQECNPMSQRTEITYLLYHDVNFSPSQKAQLNEVRQFCIFHKYHHPLK